MNSCMTMTADTMAMRPGVSVALCTFNGARFVREQVDSLLCQTIPPVEIIVIDDMSSDNTVGILQELARTASVPMTVISNTQRLGSTNSFAQAIERCSGEFIALCDQDDIWLPNKLEHLSTALRDNEKATMAFCNASLVNDRLEPLGKNLWDEIGFYHLEQAVMRSGSALHVLLRHDVVSGMGMMFRAKFTNLILPFGRTWMHDTWITTILAAIGECCPVNEELVLYRQHSGQQLGCHKVSVLARLRASISEGDKSLMKKANQLEELYNRLVESKGEQIDREALSLIDDKHEHLLRRLEARESPIWSCSVLLREWRGKRYRTFSSGGVSAARDLFGGIRS